MSEADAWIIFLLCRVEARRFVLCAGGCCVAGGASPLAPPALFSPTTGEPVLACAPCKPCAPAKAAPTPEAIATDLRLVCVCVCVCVCPIGAAVYSA